jgi:hypothetical protein
MIETRSLAHLLGRLGVVEDRIRRLVAVRRADDPLPDDAAVEVSLSDEALDRLVEHPDASLDTPETTSRLEACERAADEAEDAGCRLRLRDLAETFSLEPLDVDLLLVALSCELDPRFERLFGYLDGDSSRRRPSVAVALELCGVPLSAAGARARLQHGPLVRGGLVAVDEPGRPFPGRPLRVPDRVVRHLLGDDEPDPAVAAVLDHLPEVPWGDPRRLAQAIGSGVTLAYLREPATGSGRVLGQEALGLVGLGTLLVDLTALAAQPDGERVARLVVREARLTRSGVVAGPVSAAAGKPALLNALLADPRPLLLVGDRPWDPTWTATPPLLVDVPPSTHAERRQLWQFALAGTTVERDSVRATDQFRLRPEGVARAAASAQVQVAMSVDGVITGRHLRAGAHAESGSALELLAHRVDPEVGWDDLVLPSGVLTSLKEAALRARHRERVLGDWRMRPGGARGHGVAALFAGDAGTGKTMAAEVIARELGLDLYVVDLATVLDDYVGETEQNLERIFSAASGINAVLLLDEADAVFARRSDVRDAHGRYASIESTYLLQQVERFDGLAILATRLRAAFDDGFIRRLDVVVDLPLPDVEHRRSLWDRSLGHRADRDPDIDLAFVAGSFELTGGSIRSAAVTAAYLAADDGGPMTMRHVVNGVQREYRKLGRLCLESEFGRYWPLLA